MADDFVHFRGSVSGDRCAGEETDRKKEQRYPHTAEIGSRQRDDERPQSPYIHTQKQACMDVPL